MNKCKFCNSEEYEKRGTIRGKARYKCKSCEKTYTLGDNRIIKKNKELESLVILLYSTGKASYRFIGKLLNLGHNTVYRWIKNYAEKHKELEIDKLCKEIELDEMWHYIQKKVINAGYSKQLIERQEGVLHMLQDKETLKQYISCMRNLNI